MTRSWRMDEVALLGQARERLCVYLWESRNGHRFLSFKQAHRGEIWSIEAGVNRGTGSDYRNIDRVPAMDSKHRFG
jgi:hypothetical protein